jgi:rhodanese-related sulfurtransferase
VFKKPQVPTVDVEEAAQRLSAGAMLVDVREDFEWAASRVPGAVHRPIGEINDWWEELPSDRDVIFICHSGSRSAQVVQALSAQAGMSNVWNLAGGMVAWSNGGQPVDTEPVP